VSVRDDRDEDAGRCEAKTRFGRCEQRSVNDAPVCSYHKRLALGLLEDSEGQQAIARYDDQRLRRRRK